MKSKTDCSNKYTQTYKNGSQHLTVLKLKVEMKPKNSDIFENMDALRGKYLLN